MLAECFANSSRNDLNILLFQVLNVSLLNGQRKLAFLSYNKAKLREIRRFRITCKSGMQHKYFALGDKLSWGPWRDLVTQASGGLEYGTAEGSLVGLKGFGPSNHEGEDE